MMPWSRQISDPRPNNVAILWNIQFIIIRCITIKGREDFTRFYIYERGGWMMMGVRSVKFIFKIIIIFHPMDGFQRNSE